MVGTRGLDLFVVNSEETLEGGPDVAYVAVGEVGQM